MTITHVKLLKLLPCVILDTKSCGNLKFSVLKSEFYHSMIVLYSTAPLTHPDLSSKLDKKSRGFTTTG
jgi:hypothetical protein